MTTLETITLLTAIIGAAVGLLGAVLGVMNTWWTWASQYRVKLRVIPGFSVRMQHVGGAIFMTGNPPEYFEKLLAENRLSLAVQVINLSAFPVTIASVGFRMTKNAHRGIFVLPEVSHPFECLPARLESRQSVTCYCDPGQQLHLGHTAIAFAETASDRIRFGTSKIIKHYFNFLRERENEAQ